jgi:Protein of unknown function (DUF1353)
MADNPGERHAESTTELIMRLADLTGSMPNAVLDTAVQRYADLLLGPEPTGAAPEPGPFRKYGSDEPAAVRLQQRNATDFYLVEPFRYFKDGVIRVVPKDHPLDPHSDVTDLASVPNFLTWLVPRYGRHSLPALLHDDLQHQFDGVTMTSRKADAIFRDAMGDTRVPFMRRWLMWSAVSARTRWNLGVLWQAVVLAWVLLYGAGFWLAGPFLVAYVLSGAITGIMIAAVLVSPFLLCWLWIWERRAAVIFAYGLLVATPAIVLVSVTTGIYALLEWIAKLWDKDHPIRVKNLRSPALVVDLREGAPGSGR